MTIVRRVPGVFSRNLGNINFIPPVASGLVFCNLFGRDVDRSRLNIVNGSAADAAVIGPAVYGKYSVALGPDVYLQTTMPETASFTLISVARKTLGGHAYIANVPSGGYTAPHVSLETNASSIRPMLRALTAPASATLQSAAANVDTRWAFIAGTHDDAALQRLLYVGGDAPISSAASGPRSLGSVTLRVGRANLTSANYGTVAEHAATYIYNRALSSAELDTLYDHAKQWFAARSIAI